MPTLEECQDLETQCVFRMILNLWEKSASVSSGQVAVCNLAFMLLPTGLKDITDVFSCLVMAAA